MSSLPPWVGIDFGTFSCKVAWYNPKTQQTEIIKNDRRDEQTSSMIYLGNPVLVGREAEEMLKYADKRRYVVASIKRELVEADGDIRGQNTWWSKKDIIAEILKKLKQDAEKLQFHDHDKVTRAVITHPVSFSGSQKKMLREAATDAGFTLVELLVEPVAAALAYMHAYPDVGNHVLVYDLGAGTFDLAILRRKGHETFELAMPPQGSRRCGGDDFDAALYHHFEEFIRRTYNRSIGMNNRRDLQFLQRCRECKEHFSTPHSSQYMFEATLREPELHFEQEIDRTTFEGLIRSKVEETLDITQESLNEAKKNGFTVDTLLLVGGSTCIPLVQNLLQERFADLRQLSWQNSTIAVALGAAYDGYTHWEPENVYRQALRDPTNEELDDATVQTLEELGQEVGLSPSEMAVIEKEVWSQTKKDRMEQQKEYQQYEEAVREWHTQYRDNEHMEKLAQLISKYNLDPDKCAKIEVKLMGASRDEILKQQKAPSQYCAAVMMAWIDHKLEDREEIYLSKLAKELRLDEQQSSPIERDVMGKTLKEVMSHQGDLREYRRLVEECWNQGTITPQDVLDLDQFAQNRELGCDEVEEIEVRIMGDTKEGLLGRRHRGGTGPINLTPKNTVFRFVGHLLTPDRDQVQDIKTMAFNQDGSLLACCSLDARVYVWQLKESDVLIRRGWLPALQLAVACHNSSTLLGSERPYVKPVRAWYQHMQSGPYQLNTAQAQINAHVCVFSPDGEKLATGSSDGTVRVWAWRNNRILADQRYGPGEVKALAFSVDGVRLAIGGRNGMMKLYNWGSGEKTDFPRWGHNGDITSIAFSPDGRFVASGSAKGKVRLWSLDGHEHVKLGHAHGDRVSAIAFHPKGNVFASGSFDNTIHLWHSSEGYLGRMSGHTDSISTLVFSPCGLIASGSIYNEMLRLWNGNAEVIGSSDERGLLQTLTGRNGKVHAIAFSPDAEVLLVSGAGKTINVYERVHR